MSKSAQGEQEVIADSRVALGRLFQQEREKRGISVTEMANELKILSSAVKGIEQADYSAIRAEIFVRGYIRSYAAFLGLDIERCLQMYGHSKEAENTAGIQPVAPPKLSKSDGLDTLIKIIVPLVVFAVAWFSYDFVVSDDVAEPQQTEQQPVQVEEFAVDETRSVNVSDLKLQQNIEDKLQQYNLVIIFEGSSTISVSDHEGELLVDDQLKRRGDVIELTDSPWYSLLIGYGANVKVYYKGEVVAFEYSVDNPVVRLEVGEQS